MIILISSVVFSCIYFFGLYLIPSTYVFIPKFFSIFLLMIYFIKRFRPVVKPKKILIYALCASMLGDFFLTFKGEKYFLLGLLSFLVAHIFYFFTFFMSLKKPVIVTVPQKVFIGIWIVFAICMILLLNSYLPFLLKYPVYLYVSMITLMVCSATLLAPFPTLVFFGAASFAISDSLLSISTFITPYQEYSYAVWFFYYLAQLLIVNGV